MQRWNQKLKSSRGATLIIALLFFMVCIMVASVIVTAAVANMSRIEKQRDEEQVYLAAFSAARMLQEDFADMTPCQAIRIATASTCNKKSEHVEPLDFPGEWGLEEADASEPDGTRFTGSTEAFLAPYVNEAVLYILKFNQPPAEREFSITSKEPELADISVEAVMTLSREYVLKITVTARSPRGASYAITLNIAGNAVQPEGVVTRNEFCEHLEKLPGMVYDPIKGEWVEVWANVPYPVEKTTYRQTITWAPGTLAKGR